MTPIADSPAVSRTRAPRLVWGLTLFLVVIALLAVTRRTYVLLHPPQGTVSPRFAAAAAFDAGFAQQLAMSFTMSIGGASETAATTLYAILFLVFLGLGFRNIRRRRIAQHREWMIRAFGVILGIATTRPIVGAFFAVGRLKPHQFFGTAFWLGFTITLLAAETWVRLTRVRKLGKLGDVLPVTPIPKTLNSDTKNGSDPRGSAPTSIPNKNPA